MTKFIKPVLFPFITLFVALVLFIHTPTLQAHPLQANGPFSNPISEPITKSGLRVQIKELVTLTPTKQKPPLARVNFVTYASKESDRLFAVEMRGQLYAIDKGVATLYLDLVPRLPSFIDKPGLGTGLQFLAFHPDFARNGKFYTVHSEGGEAISKIVPDLAPPAPYTVTLHGVLTEWTAKDPKAATFEGSWRTLLRIAFRTTNHNFQQISFNPNAKPNAKPNDPDYGKLYISLGDGEDKFAWSDAPQNLSVPYGKLLRIDPAGKNSANHQYGIPADNPFVGKPGKLGEIWAYGLRNPHRFTWDTGGTQRMILTNIGEKNVEAVLLGTPGANYGWNLREGPYVFKHDDLDHIYPLPADDKGFTYPVAMYDHDEGNAIVGGFVYRGADIPELQGKYLFGDIVQGRIFYCEEKELKQGSLAKIQELTLVDEKNKEVTLIGLVKEKRVDLRFGIDRRGELMVSSKQIGTIWRVLRAGK